ncbi:lipopolysaccharide transport periplasmic protein LptA [Methylomagnum ishizawai]|uniref:lipopolysaccharide transport periplasmic protein LptA n=1 Tax=Methylomagnum ishizawai TaxID=1760988 RepID=UPI001FE69AB8|nr:lipopolysaccharide transport periplasmic protein LptA [Methylomagnum ishizawai]
MPRDPNPPSTADGNPKQQGKTMNKIKQGGNPKLSGLALLGLMAAAQPTPALDSDSKQPMYIESDTATYDEKKGETVYVGNVKATQGSLEVYGDKMTVYQKDNKTDKIIILGRPARLKQRPEGGDQDMHGTGQRADYFPETGILILYDKAVTWEGEDINISEHVVRSDRIEYDTRNSLYKAGNASTGSKRVHVTILPKKEEDSASPAP